MCPQCIFGALTPRLRAVDLWMDPSGCMFISGLNRATDNLTWCFYSKEKNNINDVANLKEGHNKWEFDIDSVDIDRKDYNVSPNSTNHKMKGILRSLGTWDCPQKRGRRAMHHRYEHFWISKTKLADRNARPDTYSLWNDSGEHIWIKEGLCSLCLCVS